MVLQQQKKWSLSLFHIYYNNLVFLSFFLSLSLSVSLSLILSLSLSHTHTLSLSYRISLSLSFSSHFNFWKKLVNEWMKFPAERVCSCNNLTLCHLLLFKSECRWVCVSICDREGEREKVRMNGQFQLTIELMLAFLLSPIQSEFFLNKIQWKPEKIKIWMKFSKTNKKF